MNPAKFALRGFSEGPQDYLRVGLPQRRAKSRAAKLVAVLSFVLLAKRGKGVRSPIVMVGRGHTPRSSLLRNWGEWRIYPLRLHVARVERSMRSWQSGCRILHSPGSVDSAPVLGRPSRPRPGALRENFASTFLEGAFSQFSKVPENALKFIANSSVFCSI